MTKGILQQLETNFRDVRLGLGKPKQDGVRIFGWSEDETFRYADENLITGGVQTEYSVGNRVEHLFLVAIFFCEIQDTVVSGSRTENSLFNSTSE
jgi:hypothetical protein